MKKLITAIILFASPAFGSSTDNPRAVGGSNQQLQYNNSGLFGGMPSTYDGSTLSISTPTTVTSTFTAYALTVTSVTASAPLGIFTKSNSGNANEDGGSLTFQNMGPAATNRTTGVTSGAIKFNFSQPTSGADQAGATLAAQADGTQSGANTPSKLVFKTYSSASGLSNALVLDATQNATFYGLITFSPTTKGIQGTTTNDSPTAGVVGEVISACVSAVSQGGNNVFTDVSSVTLTAGDWDLSVMGEINPNGATMTIGTVLSMGFSTTSGNSQPDQAIGNNTARISVDSVSTLVFDMAVVPRRVSIASNTVYYLKTKAQYSVATPVFTGCISGRRAR